MAPRTAPMVLLGALVLTVALTGGMAATRHANAADAFKAAGLNFADFMKGTSGTLRRVPEGEPCERMDGGKSCLAAGFGVKDAIDPVLALWKARVERPVDGHAVPSELAADAAVDSAGDYVELMSSPSRVLRRGAYRGQAVMTYVLDGKLAFHDAHGLTGVLESGDAGMVCAGEGTFHPQMGDHNGETTAIVLWMFLPEDEFTKAATYHKVKSDKVPEVDLLPAKGKATAKLLAGSLLANHGPLHAHTRMVIADISMDAHSHVHIPIFRSFKGGVFVISGDGFFGGDLEAKATEGGRVATETTAQGRNIGTRGSTDSFLPIGSTSISIIPSGPDDSDDFVITTLASKVRFLLVVGDPLHLPHVSSGPFLAGTMQEMKEVFHAYADGELLDSKKHLHRHNDPAAGGAEL